MLVFQSNPDEKTGEYVYIEKWLKDRFKGKIEKGEEDGYGVKTIYLLELDGTLSMTLMHETAHMWLERGAGYQGGGIIPLVKRTWEGKDLDQKVFLVFKTEKSLSKKAKESLEGIFGQPEKYMATSNFDNKRIYRNFLHGKRFIHGKRYVGNLVDESGNFLIDKIDGHPLDDFTELFASFISTLAFGEIGLVLGRLQALETLSKRFDLSEKDVKLLETITGNFRELLVEAQKYGVHMISDMEKHDPNLPPRIMMLKNNLQAAGKALGVAEGTQAPAQFKEGQGGYIGH
ncbi:MAG: hypothetical protein WC717_01600 [Candidatus Micrarchaeia archaeon]